MRCLAWAMITSSEECTVKELTSCAPPLPAKLAPWMEHLRARADLLDGLLNFYGSPLHLFVGGEFRRNCRDLLSALKERSVSGSLFFARKANKLPCFVLLAKEEGIGVDVASVSELRETLELGLAPEKIVLTAIGKSPQLIKEAAGRGVLIVIENEDELKAALELSSSADAGKMRVGLRFSGFEQNGRKLFSRFGFDISDAPCLLESIAACPAIELEFFHAHLDRYDTEERTEAAGMLLELVERARQLGLAPGAIDLGGGILIRYLQSEEDWLLFNKKLKSSVLGKEDSFTYLDDGLGYIRAGTSLLGKADLYPAYNHLSKERFLGRVLDNKYKGEALYKRLIASGVSLYFEPGRALVDNCGMSFARVAFRKKDTLGNTVVGLDMNRLNLRPFRAEFCSDPLLLELGSRERQDLPAGAFLVGKLCSESDLIYRRKIDLKKLPVPGDIIAFANTAGYLVHHMEIGTHGDPLPKNLLISQEDHSVLASW